MKENISIYSLICLNGSSDGQENRKCAMDLQGCTTQDLRELMVAILRIHPF